MSKQIYTSLHNHSEFSKLKSVFTSKDLLQKTKEQGHDTYGVGGFFTLAEKQKVAAFTEGDRSGCTNNQFLRHADHFL